MTPLALSLLVGALVVGGVLALLFALLRNKEEGRAAERLDLLVGRSGRKDSSADMLLKQALQEVDKKNILDQLTPEFLNLSKVIEQADANVKPGALFGIGLAAAAVTGLVTAWMVNLYVAPVLALVCFTAPFIWLFWKRKQRMAKFAAQ